MRFKITVRHERRLPIDRGEVLTSLGLVTVCTLVMYFFPAIGGSILVVWLSTGVYWALRYGFSSWRGYKSSEVRATVGSTTPKLTVVLSQPEGWKKIDAGTFDLPFRLKSFPHEEVETALMADGVDPLNAAFEASSLKLSLEEALERRSRVKP